MLNTIEKKISSIQLRKLKKFGSRVDRFGVNFAVFSANGERILLSEGGRFKSDCEQLQKWSQQALEQSGGQYCSDVESDIYRFGKANQVLVAVLKACREAVGVAMLDLGDAQSDVSGALFSEMLTFLAENFAADAKADEQIDKVSAELSQVYEELVLLHKLSTNMKVTEPDANFLQMACDKLTDIVSVEGIAILLEKTIDGERQFVLTAGSGLIDIDEHMTAILYSRLMEEMNSGKEALLDSEVDSHFKYDWADNIRNIIAVPLCGKEKAGTDFVGDLVLQKTRKVKGIPQGGSITAGRDAGRVGHNSSIIGLMVAINRIDKPDFDSTDVKLFTSVAMECAVFIENGRLFKDLKELFIGSLKALTNSIDAKDRYTRGHSERVAFISRWIAERIAEEEGLEEEQIHKIYLAGLLHDIGKVGIDEAVLRKEGKLTKEELDHIRAHPSIGAGIIREIRQMSDVMPGILYHHERVDGKGYPSGLIGEQIPLMGKIIGLADSFDAMTSKRTYRGAMTVRESLQEVEKGLGTQFDEKIGRAFVNSDVYQLWNVIRDGFTETHGKGDFSEYGAVAVGTLIR